MVVVPVVKLLLVVVPVAFGREVRKQSILIVDCSVELSSQLFNSVLTLLLLGAGNKMVPFSGDPVNACDLPLGPLITDGDDDDLVVTPLNGGLVVVADAVDLLE